MKNLNIISLVVIITLVGIWSCSKNEIAPSKTEREVVVKKELKYFQNENQSNARHVSGDKHEQIKMHLGIMKEIGRNQNAVTSIEIQYNANARRFNVRNLKIEQQYTLPPGYDGAVESLVVTCWGGTQHGASTTCDDYGCVTSAVDDCAVGGGCALVCPDRHGHPYTIVTFFPKGL